jgi:hypothetical protein
MKAKIENKKMDNKNIKSKEKLKIQNVKCITINQSIKKQGESKVGIKRKRNQIADGGREFGGGGGCVIKPLPCL